MIEFVYCVYISSQCNMIRPPRKSVIVTPPSDVELNYCSCYCHSLAKVRSQCALMVLN